MTVSAQLYQSRPQGAAPLAQRPSTVAPAPVPSPGGELAAAGNAVDDYLDDSFRLVSADIDANRLDVAIRRLMDSAKQGRAKDVLAALQLRSMQLYRANPKGDVMAAMRTDGVFAEAMQVLGQLSAARSADAYYVLALLYRHGTWLPVDANKSRQFMQAAADGGVQAAREILKVRPK